MLAIDAPKGIAFSRQFPQKRTVETSALAQAAFFDDTVELSEDSNALLREEQLLSPEERVKQAFQRVRDASFRRFFEQTTIDIPSPEEMLQLQKKREERTLESSIGSSSNLVSQRLASNFTRFEAQETLGTVVDQSA